MRARHRILSLLLVASASACGTDTITFEPLPDGGPLADAGPIRTLGGATVRIVDSVMMTEGASPWALATVSSWSPAGDDVTVTYDVMPLTATAGSDYTVPTSRTLTVSPFVGSALIGIPVVNDSLLEADEQFRIHITSVTGATIEGSGACLVTIRDDDRPVFTINAVRTRTYEGSAVAPSAVRFVVEQNGAPTTASVRFRTVDGTATRGLDFAAIDTVLTLDPSNTPAIVDVPVFGDSVIEGPETFSAELVGEYVGSPSRATVTIEPPALSACLSGVVGERDTGRTRYRFVVQSSIPAPVDTRALFSMGGTASRAVDYQFVGFTTSISSVTFPVGEYQTFVDIDVIHDDVYEADETVTLTLFGAVGAAGGTLVPGCTASTLTIQNDD